MFLLTARLFAYDSMGVGNRLFELSIDWARGQGFKTPDFRSGGVDSYKRWWSPAVGDAWSFRIQPATMHALKRSKAAVSSTLGIAIGH
jgi:CelD/BcsL family acetyltransferase involved in cellulose biosynthesis